MRGHGIERNLIMPHNEKKTYSLLPYTREDVYSLQEAQQAAARHATKSGKRANRPAVHIPDATCLIRSLV